MTDDEDFVDFVTARWNALHRFAWLLTGGHQSAEDVLQLSLEKSYVRWSRIRRMDSPEAYVRRVITNAVISESRRPFHHHEVQRDHMPEPSIGTFEGGSDAHSQLWPLVCGLPPRQRAVVVLRFYEDLTEVQVADVLACSVGTVKSQTHDAMRSLRQGVEPRVTGEVTA